jgi:hypothetical protein
VPKGLKNRKVRVNEHKNNEKHEKKRLFRGKIASKIKK